MFSAPPTASESGLNGFVYQISGLYSASIQLTERQRSIEAFAASQERARIRQRIKAGLDALLQSEFQD